MNVEIKVVETKRDLRTFVKVPFGIFKGNTCWVPPLISDELETFYRKKNPAYRNADTKLFIAYKNEKPVGRIAGINSYIANEKYNTKNLRFGWFDTENDYEVASALFKAVENWAKELGMETLTGPHGFSDLDPEGMLTKGFDQLATIAVYYNHPYYPEFAERYGFKKDVDYVEFRSAVPYETGITEKLFRLVDRIKMRKGNNLKLLKFRKKRELMSRAKEVFHLLDDTFEEIYGSVPLTEEQVNYYVKKYFTFVDKDLIKVVANKDDELVGFLIAMPNLSKAFQKARGRLFPLGWYFILKALKNSDVLDLYLGGIKKRYRGLGVDLLMVTEMVKTALEKGFKYTESNVELEENKKAHAEWKYFNPRLHKRRRIYKKNI
jgi:hypothetical protein